jgi:hypothetical protein
MSSKRELAYRTNDGIEVTLLWDAADGSVTVAVVDSYIGSSFELPVESESPLDVFHHPFGYAVRREAA